MNSKNDEVAVIGMSGKFPGANSVPEFWENLCAGRDSVRSLTDEQLRSAGVPERDLADPAYVKAAPVLDGFDLFDPGFFKVSPLEAELMDPQLRLLLQCGWETLEDAGYARKEAQNIGVFAGAGGIPTSYYANFANRHERFPRMTASAAQLVNDKDFLATYLSYKLNLTGPSMTVQTACSTSLVALHQARQSLLNGECDMALAGGVSVRVPHHQGYQYKEGFIYSRSGRIRSFDAGADGVVFGSGLGLVLIKRLSDAIADGDNIYAVIKGSAIVNDGKGKMSYAASSASGQIACVRAALDKARVEPSSIGLVEAHGTGTFMGDPEEVKALSAAFGALADSKPWCALGAVKANVGHLEAAAGIVGFIKAVLAVQRGVIPPVAHFEAPNPRIEFDSTPFYVNTGLKTWDAGPEPRRAAVNSLGIGGTNAFVIIENFAPDGQGDTQAASAPRAQVVVPLSAKTAERLREAVQRLAQFIDTSAERGEQLDLEALAYTLQTGRMAMEARAAFVAGSLEQLRSDLAHFLDGQPPAMPPGEPATLAASWLAGGDVDWSILYGGRRISRISLPTYPFARQRCWIDSPGAAPAGAVLHPLLHANTSDLYEYQYKSTFTGEEFFLNHHQVRLQEHGSLQKVLPAVAYLEMARAAAERAAPVDEAARVPELRDVVWLQPVTVDAPTEVGIALVAGEDEQALRFEVFSADEQVHCQGRAVFGPAAPAARVDLAGLEEAMRLGRYSAATIYEAYAGMGLAYGAAQRPITGVARGEGQLLARLKLPQKAREGQGDYVLHPSLLDGALQAATVLLFDPANPPALPIVPFAMDSLRVLAPCASEMLVWARHAPDAARGDKNAPLDIDLLDAQGGTCVEIRGFAPRALGGTKTGSLLARRVWEAGEAQAECAETAQTHVLLVGLENVEPASLGAGCEVLALDGQGDIAERYTDLALACVSRIQAILRDKPQDDVLLQLVLADSAENALAAGLGGLFKTARLEHPRVAGQVVLVPSGIATGELAAVLRAERAHARDWLVKYENGVRHQARWSVVEDVAAVPEANCPFKDHGVYLITGGLGGLGMLMAREIAARTPRAVVVLTGRAMMEHVMQDAGKRARLESLREGGAKVEYRQVDLDDAAQVEALVASVRADHGQLNGIIHSAGMTADAFLLKKSADDVRRVFAPKVRGTLHLDQASRGVDLDFLVLFSSLAAGLGNLGQGDYAAANGFLDEFAAFRNGLVRSGERRGATVAIGWPLWQDGGMQPDQAARERLYESTGALPMRTSTGLHMFYRALTLGLDQALVMEGDLDAMRRCLDGQRASVPGAAAFEGRPDAANSDLVAAAEAFLCKQLAATLKLQAHQVDARAALEDYGIDSILALDLTRLLESTFGPLPKTLFFEYLTIGELAGYFARNHAAALASQEDAGSVAPPVAQARASEAGLGARTASIRTRGRGKGLPAVPAYCANAQTDAIAIVGLSGRYPGGSDLDAFWRNLRDGIDCIVEVPRERWDWRDYYSEDRAVTGAHLSKWGGFIEGVDEFDARFFNVSPVEAEKLDPQERLFLQQAWMAIEDAGYTRAALQIAHAGDLPAQVGVYAGVMYGEYQLFGAEASLRGERMGFAGNPASIANRVSYVLNLHGPSMVVDTMCSSSLTAIHLACQDLKLGRTALAIAGGVNVTIHPNKYLMLSAGQFISGDGHCQSFGEGGDGYIPGEGVGVVVLKRLSEAERDGNHIYGVIRGSALSHGGKTNGYTVPNPQAQASAIRQALAEAHVDPRHVSYVEAHGTGTRLGDPIEIAALSAVYRESTADCGFCLIGSAKSNIGHAEAAAGIAGLTKVLLQFKHKHIVPSLHSARLNPHIDFDATPFVVNQTLRSWEQPVIDGKTLPRIAGISSFGAGGSNAHLVVEEYVAPAAPAASSDGEHIVPLSARNLEQLRQKVHDLLGFLEGESVPSLASIAATLQLGREAMDQRLAVTADSVASLAARLRDWLDDRFAEGLYQGQAKANKEMLSLLTQDPDLHATVGKWIAAGKLAKLAELWAKGLDLDWSRFHSVRPAMVSLPTYPFAKQRFWIEAATPRRAANNMGTASLHPLLQANTSDFSQQSYTTIFVGDELVLEGAPGARRLREAAYLEMARAALDLAMPGQPGGEAIELRDVAWAQPLPLVERTPVTIALFDKRDDEVAFEVYSGGAGEESVHCQGRASRIAQSAPVLIERASVPVQQLVELRMPAGVDADQHDHVIGATMLQDALRAAVRMGKLSSQPLGFVSLRLLAPASAAGFAWVRPSVAAGWDLDLCDEQGAVYAQLRGLRAAIAPHENLPQPARTAVLPAAGESAAPARVRIDAKSAQLPGKPRQIALAMPAALAATGIERGAARPAARVLIDPLAGAVAIPAKPSASIVLAAPAETSTARAAHAAKPRVLLAAPVAAAQARQKSSAAVALYDHGDGMFVIRIDAPATANALSAGLVDELLSALRTAGEMPSLKVLTIEGCDTHFLTGALDEHRAARAAQLYQALAQFPYPVIALASGDTSGAGLLAAAACDFLVCSEEARYAFALPEQGLYPSAAHDILGARFGNVLANDFLYLSGGDTGAALKSKGWTCPIIPRAHCSEFARDLAASLAKKTQASLRLLKQQLARDIVAMSAAFLMPSEAEVEEADKAVRAIEAPSDRLRLEGRGERVLLVTVCAAAAAGTWEELLAEMEAVFARIEGESGYRCLVLASELPQFLPLSAPGSDSAILQRFKAALAVLDRPVVAALRGDAQDSGWLAALCCDACVHSQEAHYGFAQLIPEAAQAADVPALVSLHLGEQTARQLLLAGASATGAQLRETGALYVVDADEVLAYALKLADTLSALPLSELRRWKRRVAAQLAAASDSAAIDAYAEEPVVALDAAPAVLSLSSEVVTALAHADGVLEVRMNDREAKNMFSPALTHGLREVFDYAQHSQTCKVVLLTGFGNYFSSGGTRETLLAIGQGQARFTDNLAFRLPLDCPVPVVAAMQGHAIGAGWAMGMFADFSLFSDESRYFSPYMDYGFTPGAGATLVFPHRVGLDLARETLLTAREYAGGALHERGLRHPVLPREQVVPAGLALARRIAQAPRERLVALKRRFAAALVARMQETFDRELAMHEQTFVGQAETLARIESASRAMATASSASSAQAVQPAPAAMNLDEVMAGLRRTLAQELRMQEHEIGEDEQFVDLGLDSITGVTWIRRINETYGTAIEAIRIYSYPTLARLARFVLEESAGAAPMSDAPVAHVETAAAPAYAPPLPDLAAAIATLRALLAHELRMQESEIGEDDLFVDLGLDSITGVTWIRKINDTYGTAIDAIKIYSHPSLRQLARFVQQEAAALAPVAPAPAVEHRPSAAPVMEATPAPLKSWRKPNRAKASTGVLQPVAVVGMAGKFAQSPDLEAFWRNIAQGRDCIVEIPAERWDIDLYYQEGEAAPGKTYSRWMGVVDDYDRFDAAFFNISPREAKSMDPQQRLFLQACWHSIEHAGYNPRSLAGSRCGVFVGCAASDYHQLSRSEQLSGQGFTGASPSILAARISYLLDLHGPSLAIDTACSSSLVALATACDSLVSGGSDIALAGGVNVMAGAAMQIMTAQTGMLSPHGRCFAFDERANGIVNGEGVGVVMLKRLADAQRDNDRIYGVVEGWGLNQDGKTNGITAPNADSQARLQQEVYEKFGIDPAGIGLLEAHGTGTALGDPIEVAGLKASFGKFTSERGYCALGSVKTNIGHCLSAAGISGFLKVLLALKHGQIPPTVHFNKLNHHIALDDSPFYVSQWVQPWEPIGNGPRRAAINAFGFSGTNAHIVVAEYLAAAEPEAGREPALVPLSARTAEELVRKAQDLLAFLDADDPDRNDLGRIAHTLQVGREEMLERVAIVCASVDELKQKLRAFADGSQPAGGVYRGQAGTARDGLLSLGADADFQAMIAKWISRREWAKLADLWVQGFAMDWSSLYAAGAAPRRIGLPGYPFAAQRHWIDAPGEGTGAGAGAGAGTKALHPLVHVNTSDLACQKYSSTFAGDEAFFVERALAGGERSRVLSAGACLELARAAAADAIPAQEGDAGFVLRDVVWGEPARAGEVSIALFPEAGGAAAFELFGGTPESVHARGICARRDAAAPEKLDLAALRARLRDMGASAGEWLIELELPGTQEQGAEGFLLHPVVIDAAMQRALALVAGPDVANLPAAVAYLEAIDGCTAQMFAWVRRAQDNEASADIDLCDGEGNVCARLRGLAAEMPSVDRDRAAASATPPVTAPAAVAPIPAPAGAAPAGAAPVIALEQVRQQLRSSLAEALYMSPAEIDMGRSFTELGLDSIIGVEWVKSINKQHGTAISATRIYDYPSVGDLAAFLHAQLVSCAPAQAAEPAAPPVSAARVAEPAAPHVAPETLQQQLKASLAEALFMKPSEIDVGRSFTELGLDSIIGVEWVKSINKQYGATLSATRIYDYPSVKELAAHLSGQLAGQEPAPVRADSSPAPVPAVPVAARAVLPAAPVVSRTAVELQLKASLAQALFMEPSDIDVDRSFTELGLDSIIGVEWVKTINKQYNAGLSATRIYDYPSVKELATFLLGEIAQAAPQEAPMVAPVAPAVVAPASPAKAPLAPLVRTVRTTRGGRRSGIEFEPKYGKQFKRLYFYSADAEGDFDTDGEFAVRCVISPETNVCLREHVVFGQHLLPTDAYLELVYSAYRTYFTSADICLKNIALVSPLLGAQGRDTHVKVTFRRAGGELRFFVHSSGHADFSDERLHMQGLIAVSGAAQPGRFDDTFAIEQRLDAAAIPTNAGTCYAPLQELRFGATCALGRIHVADHDHAFVANPFVVYGGLCTAINYGAWLAARHYGPSDDEFLPCRIGSVAITGDLDGKDYRSYVQLRGLEQDAVECYFEIVDASGKPVLVVDGIELRRVARQTIQRQASSAPPAATAGTLAGRARTATDKVAIVGMSCRYPMSENVDAFWDNLKAGQDCVTEVPAERWSAYPGWYHADPRNPRTSYSKWGGFLDSIDTFDALFFGISPAEAELIDPQQRVFLEECWKTIESAGYAPGSLSNLSCGVYVGCSTGDYARVLAGAGQDMAGAAFMGTSVAIQAARIAYHLNLKGPALALDTACSSSLVAVHLACESIRNGENQLALAGGINLLATPLGHILTSQVGMPSRDGRCAAFDASANGIVFSEGCGVVLLKPLADAQRDNDDILGVIEGSGTNQDGKTNGITAPSSTAQERLLRQVYGKFDIDPKRISYIEAHGTATPLGDPIEVNALASVFNAAGALRNSCALGSVKSNIGHTGFAAGVAGIIKVLLCIRHRKLVPSIHYSQPNPHIAFDQSPFYVNTAYRDWDSEGARLAAVSSFGFSGTNAHVVIAEHIPSAPRTSRLEGGQVLIPLSAKAPEQLEQKVRDLLDYLRREEHSLDLARLAYTLQVGRDAMDHRLAFVTASTEQLANQLAAWLDGKRQVPDAYRGHASRDGVALAAFAGDEDMRGLIERWIEQKNLPKLADLWARGMELDLDRLREGARPRRMALPAYPFARERCWVEGGAGHAPAAAGAFTPLHPLLHRNTSDLGQQRYTSALRGDEFFLADHRVNGQPVLPAVAFLEMARAALADAVPGHGAQLQVELRHVAWAQPVVVAQPQEISIAVFAADAGQFGFEVYSGEGESEVLHCQGTGVLAPAVVAQALDLGSLRARMAGPMLKPAQLYPAFERMGLGYGPAYRGIAVVTQGEGESLVELALPEAGRMCGDDFVLHPSLMDSALQGSIVLPGDAGRAAGTPSLPFAVESVRVFAPCTGRMVAWVRFVHGTRAASAQLVKVDIDLCDEHGNVCVQMRGFSSRPMDHGASFDEAHYQSIIAGILSNEISVDDAVELGNV